MNEYAFTRLGSIIIVLIIGCVAIFFSGNTLQSWHHILVWTYILGYTHFVLGYYYQSKAVFRRGLRSRSMLGFSILSLFALGSVLLIIDSPYFPLFAILTIPYFMVHGLFNEYLLTKQQTGFVLPTTLLVSATVWITALLFFSMTHNSFFWSDELTFFNVPDGHFITALTRTLPLWVFRELPYVLFTITIPLYVISAYFLPGKQRIIASSSGVVLLLITLFAAITGSLAFVYLFAFALSYHFILWMLYYGRIFWYKSKKQFYTYIIQHLIIIIPLCVGIYSSVYFFEIFASTFTNVYTFLVFTYIHITVSFLNEPWFRKFFKIV